MKYQVIFEQDGYRSVEFETDDYDQAQEVKMEVQAQSYLCGERNFYVYIKERGCK